MILVAHAVKVTYKEHITAPRIRLTLELNGLKREITRTHICDSNLKLGLVVSEF